MVAAHGPSKSTAATASVDEPSQITALASYLIAAVVSVARTMSICPQLAWSTLQLTLSAEPPSLAASGLSP